MPLRRAWKAARLWTSGESAKASSVRSRSACESDENGACSEPASWLSHASSSPANPSRSVWEGLPPTAMGIAPGPPSSVAEGSPPSRGTNVSQIEPRARRALPPSVISTATPHLLVDVPDHDLHRVGGMLHRPSKGLRGSLERELPRHEALEPVAVPLDEGHGLSELVPLAAAHAEHVELLVDEPEGAKRDLVVRDAHQDQPPRRDHGFHPRPDRVRHARGVDHDLRSLAARPLAYELGHLLGIGPGQHLRSHARAEREPALEAVDHQDGGATLRAQEADGLPDRPRAEDRHVLAGLDAGAAYGPHRDRQRLGERGDGRPRLGRAEHERFGHSQPLLEPAVRVDADEAEVVAH